MELKNKDKNLSKCKDCDKILATKRSIRCYSCNTKYQWKIGNKTPKKSKYYNILTKEFLYKENFINLKSPKTISEETGIPKYTILYHFKKYNLCVYKSKNNLPVLYVNDRDPRCIDCNKQIWTGYIRCKECSKEYLKENPIKRKRANLGIKCSFCGESVHVMPYEIKLKKHFFCNKICQGKYRTKYFVGKNNPNYVNGTGYLPYPSNFNKNLKLKIRERDNFTCQCCGLTEEEHYRENKKINLTIHHINYNKEDCKENNLITVCNKCNIKANGNRNYWFAYYNYLIEEKLNVVTSLY